MSDSIGSGVLQIVVDGTGAIVELGKIQLEMKKTGAAAESAGKQVGTAMAGGAEKAAGATATLDAAQKKFLQTLEKSAQKLDGVNAALMEQKAAQLGVTQAAAPYIAKLKEAEKAQQDLAQATKAAQAAAHGQASAMAGAKGGAPSGGIAAAAGAAASPATDSGEALNAQQRRFIQQITREANAVNRTKAEYREFQAVQLGVAKLATPMIAKLYEAERAQVKVGLTAKQTAQAMRLLPAQMTDIVTSLASGMPPWLVFIQQGGQIKDSFGGIGGAMKALASVLTPMRLLVGGVVGAVVTLGIAFVQGQREIDAFNKSLIMSGNAIGLTSGQLELMARAISRTGVDQGTAAEALAALAAAGSKISAENLQEFSRIAAGLERTAGVPIADTAKALKSLGEDPVKASQKLTAEYGYLDVATLRVIRSLVEQGRQYEAVSMAQKAFMTASSQRIEEMKREANALGRAWEDVAVIILNAWAAIKNIGKTTPMEVTLAEKEKMLTEMDSAPIARNRATSWMTQGARDALRAEVDLLKENIQLQKRAAMAQGERTRADQAAIEADASREARRLATMNNAQKREREIREYWQEEEKLKRVNKPTSPEQIKKDLAAIEEKYKDKGGSRSREREDAGEKMLRQAEQLNATLREQLEIDDKLVRAERELVEFNAMVESLKKKDKLTTAQKQILAKEEEIRAEMQLGVELAKNVKLNELIRESIEKATEKQKQYNASVVSLNMEMEQRNQGRREQYGRELEGVGSGAFDRRRIQEEREIYREYISRQVANERNAEDKGMLGSKEYEQSVNDIKRQLSRALADHKSYYDALKDLQTNWTNGANEAMNNYYNSSRDIAMMTQNVYTGAFRGMEDSLTNFITKGKLSFKDLGDFIVEEVTRIILRVHVLGPLAQSLGDGKTSTSGSGGGPLGALFGKLFGDFANAPATFDGMRYANVAGMPVADAFAEGIIPLAKGGAFGPSGFQKFASGGIVSGATPFMFGGGRAGVMGEAGYEGVLPLARGPDGKLGVKSAPANNGGVTNINFVVHAQDAASFQKSESQIQAALAKAARFGRRNL